MALSEKAEDVDEVDEVEEERSTVSVRSRCERRIKKKKKGERERERELWRKRVASSTFQLKLIRFVGGAAATAATLVGVSQVCVCVCVCVWVYVCVYVRRLMNGKKKSRRKRRTKRKIGCCWRSRPGPPISSHLLRSLLRLPVSLERNDFFSSDFTVDSSLEASDG